MSDPSPRITTLLRTSDSVPADELLPLVYDQLRQLARARLAHERPGQTLQPTALVHEAFLRVAGSEAPGWSGRRHFFAAAAEAMRRILVEQARRKRRIRHGGEAARVPMAEDMALVDTAIGDALAVNEALQGLEAADPRAREIVNLRLFVGLTDQEAADTLGLSLRTVERQWQFIRTFLQGALDRDGTP